MAETLTSRTVVLVVDDEFLIRANAVDFLKQAGYEPVEAQNADEAIEILESRDDIRIVFTDINMPGSMDGLKLARTIRGRWPPIYLILTSGRQLPTTEELPHGALFVPKPYAHHDVIDALHKAASA